MHNQIGAVVNIGAKQFLQGEFSSCKVHTPPSSEMNKTQVTKWRVRQTTITLSIAPALLPSPLRAEEKRENHSVPETGKQSAAVICHHPLAKRPDPQVEAAERGNGRRSFCHLIFAPDQCCRYQYTVSTAWVNTGTVRPPSLTSFTCTQVFNSSPG